MPAEKSKNSLPSTSVTTMPRPLLATSGYDRVYDGEMYFSSPSSTRLALGPGRAVLIFGPIELGPIVRDEWAEEAAVAVLVAMVSVVMKSSVSASQSVLGRARPQSCRYAPEMMWALAPAGRSFAGQGIEALKQRSKN